jgi:uncharacterized protein YkwD
MIFHPCYLNVAAVLGVALLVGCSTTAIAPITPIAQMAPTTPNHPIHPIYPITQITPITERIESFESTQSIESTQSVQSARTVQNSPTFIKMVDAKRSPGLCVTADMPSEVLSQVNHIRAQGAVCGNVRYPPVKPLRWSSKLQQAADKHSNDMATHNFFSHKSASNGSTLIERLRSVDYSYRFAGENIGAGPSTVAQVMDMWVASPAHCVNMMTEHFAELGVSCKNNSNSKYKTYWTLKAAAPF